MARVLAIAPDLFFASKVKETLAAAGHEVRLSSSVEDALATVGDADLVIVDLHADRLDPSELVTRLGGKPTIGFYSHVETATREAATRAGFTLVVPRSRMAREMPELVTKALSV